MASKSWNRVELIGNLTRDPELRYTPNGAAVATFGMATNRTYTSEGEKKEEVDFHKLVAWNKLAELCNQLLKKGMRVFVSGRLQTRSWAGQDGTQRQTTEIVLEDMIILTPKSDGFSSAPEDLDISHIKVAKEEKPVDMGEVKAEDAPVKVKQAAKEESSEGDQAPPKEEVEDDLPF